MYKALRYALCLCLFGLSFAAFGKSTPPNIVFILADDLGWRDLGCYGSTLYETPNLDRLASGGLRFTDGYASANVCSPTRASILTGKYPARLRLTTWLSGRSIKAGPDRKLQEPQTVKQLPLEEVTVAEVLKERGYRTAFIGKWHLGGEKFFPEKQGFDLNLAGCDKGHPPSYFSPYKIPNLPDGPKGEYLTDRLTDESIRFLESAGSQPFLLYLSHYAVHTPLQAKPDLVAKYTAKLNKLKIPDEAEPGSEGSTPVRLVQNHAVYAAMIESLDQSVGRILQKLTESGLEQNTLVIFTSDNGGYSTTENGPTANVPLRAGKGWNYEGGIRVPLLMRWPAGIKPKTVSRTAVTSADFFPTLLALTGKPADAKEVDGVSLLPLFKGRSIKPRALYWHFPHYSPQGGGPGSMMRLGDYKLIQWFEDDRIEFFDLKRDIGERKNLAGEMTGRAREMQKALESWRANLDVQMPEPNPTYRGNQ